MDKQQNKKPDIPPTRRLLGFSGQFSYGLGSRVFSGFLGNTLLHRMLFGKRRMQLFRIRKMIVCAGSLARDLARPHRCLYAIPWRANVLLHCDDLGFRARGQIEHAPS
jgi:hypothetical protein